MKWVSLRVALGGILLAICFAWGLSYLQAREKDNQKTAAEYHQSPNCTATSSPDSTLEPCSYEPVEVVEKYFNHYHSRNRSYNIDFVVLKVGRAHMERVRIYKPLYDVLTPGSALTAQVWRGKTRFLYYQSNWYQTGGDPDRQESGIGSWRLILAIGGIYAVLALAVHWNKQRRLLYSGLGSPAAEYPLVRDDG